VAVVAGAVVAPCSVVVGGTVVWTAVSGAEVVVAGGAVGIGVVSPGGALVSAAAGAVEAAGTPVGVKANC
jgi:hypothetical protein